MKIDKALISRYSKRIPRYTSYPSALEFTEAFAANDWEKVLSDFSTSEENTALSLYCHIPFCRSLCYFCACNKIITKTREAVKPYLDSMIREISRYGEVFRGQSTIEQLHWGGGSPNFLNPAELSELFSAISKAFPMFSPAADISIELDPRTTMLLQLSTLKELGFNRISLGVQDFDKQVQTAINRLQSFESTRALCDHARDLGFKGINIDLIYGLPHQTVAGFHKTLELVSSIRPDRIALYGYAHVSWKSRTQNLFEKLPLPDAEERLDLFISAIEYLESLGYRHIGMDHFALPEDDMWKAFQDGSLHRNFMGYSTHKTAALLGFGVSAISTLPGAFCQNDRGIKSYISKIGAGSFAIERGVLRTFEDRWRAALIQDIMCRGRVDLIQFGNDWGIRLDNAQELLSEAEKDGLLSINSEAMEITELGRFFLRNIASSFDAYHRPEENRFSQSI